MNYNVIQLFHISSLRKHNNSIVYQFRCVDWSVLVFLVSPMLCVAFLLPRPRLEGRWCAIREIRLICYAQRDMNSMRAISVLAARSFNYTFYWQKKMMDSRSELADGWAR